MSSTAKNDIFYTATVLEYIARKTKNRRADIAEMIGVDGIRQIYEFADVNHCLPLAQVSDELVKEHRIVEGDYSPESLVNKPPSYTAIGKVYARLVEDAQEDSQEYPKELFLVFKSKIAEWMTNYKSAFFYSPRDYIFHSYQEIK